MNRSAAVSEHRLLNRIQLNLIFLYLLAFLLFESLVVGVTYVVLNHQIMIPMYQSVTDEWIQKTPEAIQQLTAFEKDDTKVETDVTPEPVVSWVVAPNGTIVVKDTVMTSAQPMNLAPLVKRLAHESQYAITTAWSTHVVNGTYILAGVKPLYQGNQRIGTLVSFRSLTVIHEAMEALTHIDIEIGLASILLIVPVTYWLAHRSLMPVRTAMQRQRNFVNDAAHELRTPLTLLHGTLELAEGDDDASSMRQAIREGLVETEYITELIANLSTLARMESGVTELNLRQIDFAALTKDTLAAMQPLADKRKIKLIGEGLTESVLTDGDSTRLRQLLVILIDNALKYTPESGAVRVTIHKHRSELELRIIDTGIGIAEEDLPHIFDRFYRATFAENQAHGSGIGLAIAAWIVEAHHGQIMVQSKEGSGTTFRIYLPLQGQGLGWKKVLHPHPKA